MDVRPVIAYTVAARIQLQPGGAAGACYIYPLPLPPIECGAVPLMNVDSTWLIPDQTLRDGAFWTHPLEVTGV